VKSKKKNKVPAMNRPRRKPGTAATDIISFRISEHMKSDVKDIADTDNITSGEVIRRCIQMALDDGGGDD